MQSEVLHNEAGERVFADLNTALWWEDVEKRVRQKFGDDEILLLPLIVYSDATLVSKSRKHKNETPLRIMLGNLPLEVSK